jgi:type IV secretory pathway VirB10-like protein
MAGNLKPNLVGRKFEIRGAYSVTVGSLLLLLVIACSQRQAQAPKPEPPATAAPSPADSEEEQHERAPDDRWPEATGGAANAEAKGEGAPGKKAAPAPAAPAEAARTGASPLRQEEQASQPARPAASKPKDKATLDRSAKADEQNLSEWSRSISLLEESFEQFENAIELAAPNCPAADKYRLTVCALADRICSLEEQVPTTTRRRCDDGKQRCAQAGQKYRARCDNE